MNRIVLSIIILAVVFFAGNSIAGDLEVTPKEDFISSGEPGGPFSPSFKDYQLTNNGPNTIWWGVYKTVDWLYIEPDWGPLGPAASTIVTVSLTAEANSLPEGVYIDTLTFLNISSEEEETRDVNLTVELPGGVWVAPDSYDVNLTEGLILSDTMTIGNDGIETFDFQIRTRTVAPPHTSTERLNKIIAAESEDKIFSIPTERDFTVIDDTPYKPGEVLVRFAEQPDGKVVSMQQKASILESLGGATVKRTFTIVPGLDVIELPTEMTVEQAVEQLNNTEGVLYAQPNYEVYALSTIPNDTLFDDLWGMHNTGQSGGTVDADIDAPEAWDITTGSDQIIVAVIDTGIDYTHSDLADNMWINEGEIPGNGVDDDGNGYVDDVYGYDFRNDDGNPMDDHYHGTHCAGTIGGVGNNNQGVAGVCWDVRLMAIKFLGSGGSGWTDDAIASVEYSILMGANLSSNSWGGGSYSQALKDAIDAAGAAGMLFVAAAGNDGTNNDTYPHYPSSFDCESLIAVLSTDKYDDRSSFSNYGPTSVDLGAPGSSILSCEPGNQYQYLSGTSMATPHVAGACALIWSMNPMMSNSEAKDIILSTVDQISSLNGKCVSNGRLNVYQAALETKVPWLVIEPEEGTVEPNEPNIISVTFDATEMEPGVYYAEIIIITNDPYNPEIIVPVTMTVIPDALQASPQDDFEVTGPRGGPFEPNCISYTLTNIGIEDINWSAYNTETWLMISPEFGLLEPNETVDVNVCFSSNAYLLDPNIYQDTVFFENLDSGCIRRRTVSLTVEPPDSFAEIFDGYNDLTGLMLTFMPDGSSAYYEACRQKISEFPTDPNGGTNITLWDDDYGEVILNDGNEILFYGNWYDRFYIGSNGYITFGEGDTEYETSMEHHFSIPRIAGLFTDLNPSSEQNISYKQLDDRIVVTYRDVPLYGDKTAKNSFQIELYLVNGKMCIAWLDTDATASIAGLSEGFGLPPVLFKQSDLSQYPICWPLGDFNRDYIVNFWDYSAFAACWLETDCTIPYWCGKSDLDFSSAVNGYDFLLLIENWLFENPWWLEPVAHWKFDEGEGDIAYDSIGNNHGTIYGATWTAGKIGWALDFDGTNDYVETTTIDEIDQPISISAWIKTYGSNETQTIFGRNQGDSYVGYSYENCIRISKDNFVYFGDRPPGGGVTYLTSTEPIEIGQWHHIVVTRDANSFATLYINGCFDNNDTVFNIDLVNVKYRIGRVNTGHYPFNGLIDDVRIYDRALTDEEIWQIYQEGLGDKASNPYPEDGADLVDPNVVLSWTPRKDAVEHDVYFGTDFNDVNEATPDSNEYKGRFSINSWDPCGLDFNSTYYWRIDEITNPDIYKGDIWSFSTRGDTNDYLVSWWKLDEGEGDIAYDSAGDNHGNIYGANWITGKIGWALDFDGTDDYVETTTLDEIDQPISISVWVKTYGSDESQTIFGRNQGNSYVGYSYENWLRVYHDNIIYFGDRPKGGGVTYLTSTEPILIDHWYHIVITRDSNGYSSLYIDGHLDNSETVYDIDLNTVNYRIGRVNTGHYPFNGIIDDVRIYNRALTDEEVWQLYQDGLGD